MSTLRLVSSDTSTEPLAPALRITDKQEFAYEREHAHDREYESELEFEYAYEYEPSDR